MNLNNFDDDTRELNIYPEGQTVTYKNETPYLKWILGSVVVLIAIILFSSIVSSNGTNHTPLSPAQQSTPTSYAECEAAGGMIQESWPSVCVTDEGESFEQPIANACWSLTDEQMKSPEYSECAEYAPKSTAEKVGEETGNIYNQLKQGSKEFWNGFKEETR